MPTPVLRRVLSRLNDRLARADLLPFYRVPGLWLDPYGPEEEQVVVPERFFAGLIEAILAQPPPQPISSTGGPGEWSRRAVAYNLFVRAGAAWDHDGDGRIAVTEDAAGWRETGTFLKAIALLPFLRSLGCNTVHLLPITAIGRDGHKGDLGSPFAIRDPYALDEGEAEPALGLGAAVEFAAFTEAAHHLGLRVVLEFVFRTAAKDAAWAGEHPEWFYWIRAGVPDRRPGEIRDTSYGAPLWAPEELQRIYRQVGEVDFDDLPAPHAVYRRMFLPPPPADAVFLRDGRWVGVAIDPETGEKVEVRVPGAFADWTPDSDQPPWSDVTYLRLYDHPHFNYIAYNTVRMYDTRLARPENAVLPLWDKIVEIIPHYQRRYGIDGVMIDMGHALPPPLKRRIVDRAREVDPDFALWAEDFDLRPSSRAEGYNACVGPYMQTVRERDRLARWLRELAVRGVPVPFLAMAENHNCPRAVTWPGRLTYATYAQAVGAFLPGIPYVHGGLELAESRPVNTGFDFTPEQLERLPASALYLFSAGAYDWTLRPNLVAPLRRLHAARARCFDLAADPAPGSVQPLQTGNEAVIGFARGGASSMRLAVLANSDMAAPQLALAPGARGQGQLTDLLGGGIRSLDADGGLTLAPGEVFVYEVRDDGRMTIAAEMKEAWP